MYVCVWRNEKKKLEWFKIDEFIMKVNVKRFEFDNLL